MRNRIWVLTALTIVLTVTTATAGTNKLAPWIDNTGFFVFFPKEFQFSFGGVKYSDAFVCSNGFVMLGGIATTAVGTSITRANFLTGLGGFGNPFIGTWTDLNPTTTGTITAGQSSPTSFTISWQNVPFAGLTAGTFNQDIILNSNGSFSIRYGTVTGLPPSNTTLNIVGFATGRQNAIGTETPTDLSAATQPIGNGTQAAIFEEFDATTNLFDLSGVTLNFNPAMPASGKLGSGDDTVHAFQIPGGFPFHGNTYYDVWWCSNGFLNFTQPNADFTVTLAEWLHQDARVAPLWADHNPGGGGTLTVAQTASSATFNWVNVPAFGSTATSTFGITLNSNNATYPGRIVMTHGSVAVPTTTNLGVTGVSGGFAATAGTETSTNLSSLPFGYGANEPALFELWAGPTSVTPPPNPVDLAGATSWNAFTGPYNLSLLSGSFAQVDLKDSTDVPFKFPFAGASYDTVWVSPRGFVSFECITTAETITSTTIATNFLARWPRIAALFKSWVPEPSPTAIFANNEGSLTITRGPGSQTFSWHTKTTTTTNPPVYTDFSLTLNSNGSFSSSYPVLGTTSTASLVGYSVGGNRTAGTETATDLSARVPPPVGEGCQTAIFEFFAAVPDLAGSTVTFANGSLPVIYMTPPRINTNFNIAIGDWAVSSGLPYVAAVSHLPGPTPLGDGRNLHLDITSPLFFWSLTNTPPWNNFQGNMDGFGQNKTLSISLPNEMGLVGAVAYFSFVTTGPCSLGICAVPQTVIGFTVQM